MASKAEMRKAIEGLLQDIDEVLESMGEEWETGDTSGYDEEGWWDNRVTAGLHHIYVAQAILGAARKGDTSWLKKTRCIWRKTSLLGGLFRRFDT
jgi:hypothetical protein